MDPTHPIRRFAGLLAGLAAALLTPITAAPAALATPRPRPPGWNKHPPLPASLQPAVKFPPDWDKHPLLPGHVHPLATIGTPGWQLALMAVTVVLLAATLAAIGYLGPGRYHVIPFDGHDGAGRFR